MTARKTSAAKPAAAKPAAKPAAYGFTYPSEAEIEFARKQAELKARVAKNIGNVPNVNRGTKLAAIREAFAAGAVTVAEMELAVAGKGIARATIATQVSRLRKEAGLSRARMESGPCALIREAFAMGVKSIPEMRAAYPELNVNTIKTQVSLLKRGK